MGLKRSTSVFLAAVLVLMSFSCMQIFAGAETEKEAVYKFRADRQFWSQTQGNGSNGWGSYQTINYGYNSDGSLSIGTTEGGDKGSSNKFLQLMSNWYSVPATDGVAYIDIANKSDVNVKVRITVSGYTTPADSALPVITKGDVKTIELGMLTGSNLSITIQDASWSSGVTSSDDLFTVSPIYILNDVGEQDPNANKIVYKFNGNHNYTNCEGWNGSYWAADLATAGFSYKDDGSAIVNTVENTYSKFRQLNSNWVNAPQTDSTAFIDITNNSNRIVKVKIVTGGYATPADSSLPVVGIGETKTIELGFLTGGKLQIVVQDSYGADQIVPCDNIFVFSSIYCKPAEKVVVSVDSEQFTVNKGEKFILPENNNEDFVAYSDGEKLYNSGSEITVDSDIALTSINLSLNMRYGASLRYSESTGIRFYTNVDTDKVTEIEALGANVELGTLISMEDIMGGKTLTLDSLKNHIKVEYNPRNEAFERKWFSEDDFKGFVGSVYAIKEHHLNGKFIGRGYALISYNDGETEVTKKIYANYSDNNVANNSRSICFIANSIKNSDKYSLLTSYQKSVIDSYSEKFIG